MARQVSAAAKGRKDGRRKLAREIIYPVGKKAAPKKKRAAVNITRTKRWQIGFVTGIAAAATECHDARPLATALSSWGFKSWEIDKLQLNPYDVEKLALVMDELRSRERQDGNLDGRRV